MRYRTDATVSPRDGAGAAGAIALVSIMAELHCATFWEGLLAPPFVFFFKPLYPFALANDPQRRTAAAAGGCMLVRADALRTIGGFAAIRGALIDDCMIIVLGLVVPSLRWAAALGVLVWLAASMAYWPMARFYRLPALWR